MSKKQLEGSSNKEIDETTEVLSTFEPFFEAGPIIGSGDSSISTAPDASLAAPSDESLSNQDPASNEKIRSTLENVSVAELWGQYVKSLMMAVPSNMGRANYERTAGLEAEKYLEKILKISPATSSTDGTDPLQVPCFNPEEQSEISEDEKYKVEILKATKADNELIRNTAVHLQALVLVRRGKGEAVGLKELRKFNTALQEATDVYRETMTSYQDRSSGRIGNYQYRVSYAGKTETYHADAMRSLILDQLPLSVRFFTEKTKSEKLKNVLHEMREKRRRKH